MTNLSYKLAMGQMRVEGGNVAGNLERATAMVRQAAVQGCAIVVLPECLNLGWSHPSARTLAEPIPGSHSKILCQAAYQYQIYVVAGLVEREGERLYNAAILIAPDGTILLKHRKINELNFATELYSTGEQLSVVATPLGIIGVAICADNLPDSLEIGTTLAEMGAQLLLSPCSWAVEANHDNQKEPYGDLWKDSYTTLAKRHKLTVIGVSDVGWITAGAWEGRKCIGCSLAVGADGAVIAQAPYGDAAESLTVITIQLSQADLSPERPYGHSITRPFQKEALLSKEALWWQSGIIYQVYPRSFKDSNNDGIGDLGGIIEKLDYLSWLGINAIWLSPFYPSPLADFGYDVSDYVNVDPLYGDLTDFDRLVQEAHARNLKVIIDLVPNHTSDEHQWFQEACSARTNAKRDWYIWQDPKPNGEPPNNWLSYFGGSAWEWDADTGQYYLHLFHVKQPDLNWRNPVVREAIYAVMHFWFKRGVDGFRIDVLLGLIKDAQLRDNPLNPKWKPGDPLWMQLSAQYTEDQPEVHEIIREMRQLAEQYPEKVLIGEMYLPYAKLMPYYGEKLDGVHLPFNFGLLTFSEWSAEKIRQLVEEYEASLPEGAWANWVLGNHDTSRIASRIGKAKIKLVQMLLLTLRGTPTCYYGDELGMANVPIPTELAQDPIEMSAPGHGRDPERTPMQWDSSPNAGFCLPNYAPWLPVSPDFKQVNVECERQDPTSVLTLVHKLIKLRNTKASLALGSYQSLANIAAPCFVYLRKWEAQQYLIALNFSDQPQQLVLPQMGQAQIVLSTELDREGMVDLTDLVLRENEGLIIELKV